MAWERVENDGLEVLTEFGEQILEWASRNPEAAKALVENKAGVWECEPDCDPYGFRLDRPEGDGR